MMKKVLFVVPVFNEEVGIKRFLDKKMMPMLEKMKKYETGVVLVDDGSRDRTRSEVENSGLFREEKVSIVRFTRNFGKEAALTAGIEVANEKGADAVVLIDGDGQHPVEAVEEMIEKWEGGAAVVKAVRVEGKTGVGANCKRGEKFRKKRDGRGHRLGSRMYYWLSRRLGNGEVREGEMDFGLISREVMEEFLRFSEHKRIVRGLIDYLGFPKEYVEVRVNERIGGKPSYSKRKLMALAADSIVAGSRRPLVMIGGLGAGITLFSGILGLFILVEEYILKDPVGLEWSGAVAVSVFVAFLVGIVLIGQAVTGIYISQIHIEAKGRPLYVIDRKRSRL